MVLPTRSATLCIGEVSLDDPLQPVVHVGRHLVHEAEHLEGGQVSALELGVLLAVSGVFGVQSPGSTTV
ncbi:hypothetical protein PC129_g17362 [Phytophthora cactorum]|uniref:Uncharacterized protein n=1 Tax=Phytophthora cactorum TaxID=29920 RepID=A0A8T1BX86_9STRA|nr:hypothetical protein PC111_g19391 [Phytophthora cactorum]KAG2819744.1 hypothetical protein PC112_g12052 [Phytophthora cactorum]KAG2855292.1 hypothetical protein PC113_g12558 [Phytophthora cactorum]KAG2882542.1 hypothetical protein PC114_g20983 [Phytophthora cactorum]KAG2890459.1 hypothetical protein PC115_g19496 [Phytophthora cactorum]